MKTRLFKYIDNQKKENFQIKNSDYFHISPQNMECGYSLEPSRQGSSNEYHNVCFSKRGKMMYTPAKPQFYYIKVGFKGVKIV